MTKLTIHISGCDDSTVVAGEFTPEEAGFLRRLADAVGKASSYNCQPVIGIEPWCEPGEHDEPIVEVPAG